MLIFSKESLILHDFAMKNIEDIVKCIHLKGTKLCVGDIIMDVNYDKFRKRIFEVVEVGNDIDHVSRTYDF